MRYVNIYNDPLIPGVRFISDIDYASLEELEGVMEYRIDKEFVVETVRLVSKEEDVALAELQRKAEAWDEIKWNRVTDGILPLEGHGVLVYCAENECHYVAYRHGDAWWICGATITEVPSEVTHWRLLTAIESAMKEQK